MSLLVTRVSWSELDFRVLVNEISTELDDRGREDFEEFIFLIFGCSSFNEFDGTCFLFKIKIISKITIVTKVTLEIAIAIICTVLREWEEEAIVIVKGEISL